MLMSLFSYMDAVCAESCGQKVSLSWSPAGKQEKNQGVVGSNINVLSPPKPALSSSSSSSLVDDFKKKGKDGISSSSDEKPDTKKQRKQPRFAVELDGVHCFETIIPYG